MRYETRLFEKVKCLVKAIKFFFFFFKLSIWLALIKVVV